MHRDVPPQSVRTEAEKAGDGGAVNQLARQVGGCADVVCGLAAIGRRLVAGRQVGIPVPAFARRRKVAGRQIDRLCVLPAMLALIGVAGSKVILSATS